MRRMGLIVKALGLAALLLTAIGCQSDSKVTPSQISAAREYATTQVGNQGEWEIEITPPGKEN